MQALEAANACVDARETGWRCWIGDADAETVQERIARVSREKAAGEKAAEKAAKVLETVLSQGTRTGLPSPCSSGYYAEAGSAQRDGPAPHVSKRRPPSVHTNFGTTPAHSHYSRPMPIALTDDGSPTAKMAVTALSVSNPLTPTSAYTSMEPIGTPAMMPTDTHFQASQMTGRSLSSTSTPITSVCGPLFMDRGIEAIAAGGTSTPQDNRWSAAPSTPMDGIAFAAFMGLSSSMDSPLPLEALEACQRERRESFPGGMDGMSVLDGSAADGWMGMRERDADVAAASFGDSEESTTWPTRARGRRGGRRQKRTTVGSEGTPGAASTIAAGTGVGAGEQVSARDRGGDLATSMALAAIGDE